MRNCRNYLGVAYDIWTGQQTWFWFVVSPNRNGGTIGAAATEAQAVREACSMIDMMRQRLRASDWINLASLEWDARLADLERYLTCLRIATA